MSKPDVPVWVGIFLLALVCRVGRLAATADAPLSGDAIQYEDLAWKVASGQGYTSMDDDPTLYAPRGQSTAFRTPGLPLFAAAVYLTVGRQPFVVRAFLVLLNAAAAIALFALALQYGRRPALIAGFAWAAWPGSLVTYWSSDVFLAESLAVPLLILGAWCLSSFATTTTAIVGGLAVGVALLTRSYLMFFLPIAVVLAALASPSRGRELRRLLLATAFSFVPLVPWTIRNYQVFGEIVPLSTQAGCSLWAGNNRDARGSGDSGWQKSPRLAAAREREPRLLAVSEPEKSRIYARATLAEVKEGGVAWFAWLIARKACLFFVPLDATHGFLWWVLPVILLFPIGLVSCLRAPRVPATPVVLAAVSSILLAVLINYHDSRYRYCAEPFLLVLAGIALDRGLTRSAALIRRRAAPAATYC